MGRPRCSRARRLLALTSALVLVQLRGAAERALLAGGGGRVSYTARARAGARRGDAVFTVPDTRYRDAGAWFEVAAPASALGVERGSGRLHLTRELPPGGSAEVLVRVRRRGGTGKGRSLGRRRRARGAEGPRDLGWLCLRRRRRGSDSSLQLPAGRYKGWSRSGGR